MIRNPKKAGYWGLRGWEVCLRAKEAGRPDDEVQSSTQTAFCTGLICKGFRSLGFKGCGHQTKFNTDASTVDSIASYCSETYRTPTKMTSLS